MTPDNRDLAKGKGIQFIVCPPFYPSSQCPLNLGHHLFVTKVPASQLDQDNQLISHTIEQQIDNIIVSSYKFYAHTHTQRHITLEGIVCLFS